MRHDFKRFEFAFIPETFVSESYSLLLLTFRRFNELAPIFDHLASVEWSVNNCGLVNDCLAIDWWISLLDASNNVHAFGDETNFVLIFLSAPVWCTVAYSLFCTRRQLGCVLAVKNLIDCKVGRAIAKTATCEHIDLVLVTLNIIRYHFFSARCLWRLINLWWKVSISACV